jgi:hypothetical protein
MVGRRVSNAESVPLEQYRSREVGRIRRASSQAGALSAGLMRRRINGNASPARAKLRDVPV